MELKETIVLMDITLICELDGWKLLKIENGKRIVTSDGVIKDILKNDFHYTERKFKSDAHTHVERLVFPAMRTDKIYAALIGVHMAGKQTFMQERGDIDSIQEHTHYLEELADANGFSSYKIRELLEINRD